MKRPQKVTRETRPNQYARKMYGKEKTEKSWKMKTWKDTAQQERHEEENTDPAEQETPPFHEK